MNDRDIQLVLRAKRQIQRETATRSFLVFGVVFCAVLRFLGVEAPFLYLTLFVLLFICLLLSSDLLVNFGSVSKKDLVSVIERHIHSDADMLTRYSSVKSRT